jgi:hypothetical protein
MIKMDTLDVKKIQENSIALFNSGYNCAQSVLIPFTDLLKIDKETAKNVASVLELVWEDYKAPVEP